MSKAPKLRFPEFEGEWDFPNADELFDSISNKEHNTDLPILGITQEHGAIPREKIDYNVIVTQKSLEGYKVVDKGDFIISLRSFQGGIEYSEYHGICSPAYIVLKKKTPLVDYFFKHYFKTSKLIKELNKNIEGIRDGKMVTYKQFSEIKLPFPSIEEQQKIADCLSALDEQITAEEGALEALENYKKGLLQQLFPEGVSKSTPPPLIFNKLPKLRFEGFEGEWEEVKLGEICNITNGKANVQDHIEGGRYPLFDRSEVVKASNEYFLDCETVILPGEGVRFTPKYYKGKFNLHQRAYALKDFSCSGLFLYYAIYAKKDLLATKAVQSTVLSLRLPILQNFEICIPVDIAEQEKIANCLSSLDELIEAKNEKIKLLKSYKKGLLQQMFVN